MRSRLLRLGSLKAWSSALHRVCTEGQGLRACRPSASKEAALPERMRLWTSAAAAGMTRAAQARAQARAALPCWAPCARAARTACSAALCTPGALLQHSSSTCGAARHVLSEFTDCMLFLNIQF
jgi:hypothetical protein